MKFNTLKRFKMFSGIKYVDVVVQTCISFCIVCQSCYDKKCTDLGVLNSRDLYSSGGQKSKIWKLGLASPEASLLADGDLLTVSSRDLPSVPASLVSVSLLARTPVILDQDPTPVTPFNLNSPPYRPHLQTELHWKSGLQHMNCMGTQLSP